MRLDGLPGPAWTRLDLDPLALAQLRAADWSAKIAHFAAAHLHWLLIRLLLDLAWLSWGHRPAVNCATTFVAPKTCSKLLPLATCRIWGYVCSRINTFCENYGGSKIELGGACGSITRGLRWYGLSGFAGVVSGSQLSPTQRAESRAEQMPAQAKITCLKTITNSKNHARGLPEPQSNFGNNYGGLSLSFRTLTYIYIPIGPHYVW